MNTLFRMILVIVFALALCAGCSTDPGGNTPHDSSITNPDGGSNDSGNVEQDGFWSGLDAAWNEGNVYVEVKTPDGQPADFFLGGISCHENEIKNTVTAKFACVADNTYEQTVTVKVTRTNYLFVPWVAQMKGHPNKLFTTSYEHEWTEAGSWGLAPNGVYVDSSDQKTKNLNAILKDGKVTMMIDGDGNPVWVTGNQFIESDYLASLGVKWNGTIQQDLSIINYTIKAGDISQQGTFTRQ